MQDYPYAIISRNNNCCVKVAITNDIVNACSEDDSSYRIMLDLNSNADEYLGQYYINGQWQLSPNVED